MARDDFAIADGLIPLDIDFADLHLGSFIHVERDFERGWGNLADFRLNGGVLPPALRQIFLEHDGGALDLVRIVLRLGDQTDFALLEAVEHFRYADGLHALAVVDGADDATLGQHPAHDHAGFPRLGLYADIVESAGVPERHEIAVQRVLVIDVAFPCVGRLRTQSVERNAPRAAELDVLDNIAGSGSRCFGGGLRGLELRLAWLRGLGCSGAAGCTFSKGFALFGSCAGLACSAGLVDSAGLVWPVLCCCAGGDWFCDQAGVSRARRQTKPAARRTRLLTLMKNMNSFPPRSLEGRKYPSGRFQLLHVVIRDYCSERSPSGQRQRSAEPSTPQWAACAQVKAGTRSARRS